MSSLRKRNALYGWAPSSNPGQRLRCVDPITGKVTTTIAGATYNNGGNMKFGLYPTVGKSVGFLNILSNCFIHMFIIRTISFWLIKILDHMFHIYLFLLDIKHKNEDINCHHLL